MTPPCRIQIQILVCVHYFFTTPDRAGCWARARRKFTEAPKGWKKGKAGSIDMELNYIAKVYRSERGRKKREFAAEDLVALRQEKAKPILENFFQWLNKKAQHVTPKSLLPSKGSWKIAENSISSSFLIPLKLERVSI